MREHPERPIFGPEDPRLDPPDPPEIKPWRSIAKAVSWRVVGTLDTLYLRLWSGHKASRSLYRPISRQTICPGHHGPYLAFLVLRVFVVFFVPPLVTFL